MKMLQIICDSGFESYLLENLEKNGIFHFTKIEKVLGKGKSSEPHMDDEVWPGYHVLYYIKLEEKDYERIKPILFQIKEKLRGKGFKVFVYEISDEI
jgi:nitrogen regulatory protein PII